MSRALGIGGATPYSMPSNHPTSYNHSHRDTVPYDASRQVKVKCGYCGCWVRKGGICSLCGTPQGGALAFERPETLSVQSPPQQKNGPRRSTSAGRLKHNSVTATGGGIQGGPLYMSPAPRSAASTTQRSIPRSGYGRDSTASPQPPQRSWTHKTALNHKHRDELPYDPSLQTKVKCRNCGCWAPKCGRCGLCGTVQGY